MNSLFVNYIHCISTPLLHLLFLFLFMLPFASFSPSFFSSPYSSFIFCLIVLLFSLFFLNFNIILPYIRGLHVSSYPSPSTYNSAPLHFPPPHPPSAFFLLVSCYPILLFLIDRFVFTLKKKLYFILFIFYFIFNSFIFLHFSFCSLQNQPNNADPISVAGRSP